MTYVTHLREDGTYQSLQEHIENVGNLAAAYAAAFQAQEHARRTGLLHDIGKYSPRAQRRQQDPQHAPKADHSTAGLQEALRLRDVPAAFAVAGHHGGMPDAGAKGDMDNGTLMARLGRKLTGEDDPSPWKQEITLPAKAEPPQWASPLGEGRVLSLYTRMLFSCLVDADYLDTEEAIQGKQPRGGTETPAQLLDKLRVHVDPWLQHPKNALCEKRSQILARCLRGDEDAPGLYTLTVPTGGGKTMSSLAFALSHAARHGMERVIYVIPYTSIIDQNAKAFAKVLGPENVLEHHSQTELSESENETPEALRKRLACENWDAPVIVTTAVQFFESLYACKPSRCRKLHRMANSVIIFDEAQTLPLPYLLPCVSAIGELVRHYGSTAVLCTATQPALGQLFAKLTPELTMREIAPEPDALYDFFKRVCLRQEGELSLDALAEQLAQSEQVLCIVNTRRRARQLSQLLTEEGRFHLSTLMTPIDREHALNQIRQRLQDGLPCRVVSTSLVEAGVDVDFPTVWRELAGLDSILQAAGRCNREGRRSAAESVVHVFTAEGKQPSFLTQPISSAMMVLEQYPEINSREAIQAYFQDLLCLRGDASLDNKQVLRSEADLNFRKTADAFRLIESDTVTIYIPTDENAEDIQSLQQGLFSRSLMRRLSRSAVNIYRYEFDSLMEKGWLEDHSADGFAILQSPELYTPECGLDVDTEEWKVWIA